MKKVIYLVSAAALMLTGASCQKEAVEPASAPLTINASMEKTKSYLDNGKVTWEKGDAIKVFSTNGGWTIMYAKTSGTNVTFAEIAGESERSTDPAFDKDNMDCAVFPCGLGETYNSGVVSFTIPATQNYAENSFDHKANFSTAKIDGNNAYFMNDCGILEISLRGTYQVKEIVLTGNADEKLNGGFTVTPVDDADSFDGAVADGSAVADANKAVTLDCSAYGESAEGAKDGGVQLDPTTAKSFYIVVPSGAFGDETHGGFIAKVNGEAAFLTTSIATTKPENVINRSRIRSMPYCYAKLLSALYKEVVYLESTGAGQYIDTDFVANQNSEAEVIWSYTDETANTQIFGSRGINDEDSAWCIATTSGTCSAPSFVDIQFGSRKGFYELKVGAEVGVIYRGRVGKISSLNGQVFDRSDCPPFECYHSALLFGRNNKNNKIYGTGKIYRCWIKDQGVWSRFFIPCVDCSDPSGPVAGMYDLVGASFYTNDGEGTFVVGPDYE